MLKKKSLPIGTLIMVLIIGVALVGFGYALWSETLSISGTVQTGEVDVEFSVHEWSECVDVNGEEVCPEPPEKADAADCLVEFIEVPTDDPTDGGPNLLQVTITGMYPSWHCKVAYDVTSTGSVPVHVWRPVPTSDIPEWVATDFDDCYDDGVQLHKDGSTGFCTMDIHFTNEQAEPEASGPHTFGWTILATQWNEDPISGPVVEGPIVGWPDPTTYVKGFVDRYKSFGNTGSNENYLGVGDLGVAANRVELGFSWPANSTNGIEFIHDASNDKLISHVDLGKDGTTDATLEYPNLTAGLAALGNGCTVADVDFMILQVAAQDADTTVAFNNVLLDGYALGDFSTVAIGNNHWKISGFDFSQSFTISGDLLLSGPFPSSSGDERSKLELLVACAP